MLHAILLSYPQVKSSGIRTRRPRARCCVQSTRRAVAARLTPDHVVVMGHKTLFVPYVDPGLVLARE